MEDAAWNGSTFTVTRYGIGARGMDYMEAGTASTRPTSYSNVGFPIYDAHGNMIATLARSGGSYAVNNQRSYDAWGVVRQGAATGDPKNRYCANLDHHQDDESGLIYMRARYYEPGSGRFVSLDPARDGANLFVYAHNNPVSLADYSGKDADPVAQVMLLLKRFDDIIRWFASGWSNPQQLIDWLKDAIVKLGRFARSMDLMGGEEAAEGEAEVASAGSLGSLGEIQARLGEIRQDLGVEKLGFGVAAKIGIALAEQAIALIEAEM